MHITKRELEQIIKEQVENYLLQERDLTKVKDPRTLSMADRKKRAEQMRAQRSKKPKKEPSTWDAVKGFFTDVESEEAAQERDYETRASDAAEQIKGMSPEQAKEFKAGLTDIASQKGYEQFKTIAGDIGKSEEEIAAGHKEKIGSRGVGAGLQTDVRNYYYNFFAARAGAQALNWLTSKFGSDRITKPIRKIVEKNAKALAMRLAAKAGLTAVGGPLAPKLLLALMAAEMIPFIAEISQEVSRYMQGQTGMGTARRIQSLRRSFYLPLSREIREKGPKWRESKEAARYRLEWLRDFKEDGYMDIIKDYREGGPSMRDKARGALGKASADDQLPRYAIRTLSLINSLGKKTEKKEEKPESSEETAVVAAASDTTKLNKRQYKRKFWRVLKKAGLEAPGGTWKRLKRNHPARVAYRNFARKGKMVPNELQAELRSLGLLT